MNIYTVAQILNVFQLYGFLVLYRILIVFIAYNAVFFSVGPNTMPCQLMVGFFAYAKSLEIHVDKQELEGKALLGTQCQYFALHSVNFFSYFLR